MGVCPMNQAKGVLFAFCENRALRAMLRGVASDLGLLFFLLPSLRDVEDLLRTSQPGVLVIQINSVSDAPLALMNQANTAAKIPVILVANELDGEAKGRALRGGAIACMDLAEAMSSLVLVLENFLAHFLPPGSNYVRQAPRTLPVCGQFTLSVPEYLLSDGRQRTRLPTIPGALLECLAAHPNLLVGQSELIRAAWGGELDATANALHQQMHRLREVLVECGLAENLKCLRGRGYVLEVPEPSLTVYWIGSTPISVHLEV